MTDRKELKIEQLDKVSGGAKFTQNESELTWEYALNKEVTLIDFNGHPHHGAVKKKGKLPTYGYFYSVYYIEFPESPEVDGWYVEDAIRYMKTADAVNKGFYPSIVVTEE